MVKRRDKAVVHSRFVKRISIELILKRLMQSLDQFVRVVLRPVFRVLRGFHLDVYKHLSFKESENLI